MHGQVSLTRPFEFFHQPEETTPRKSTEAGLDWKKDAFWKSACYPPGLWVPTRLLVERR